MRKTLLKTASTICAAIIAVNFPINASAYWEQSRGNTDNNCVVETNLPKSGDDAVLYWATKIGTADWGADGPGLLTMSDTDIYCAGGDTLYKIDKETGKPSETTGKIAGYVSYSTIAPLYAEGMVFVGVGDGKIQAFDGETLESLWLYTNENGGSTYTPITYSDGYIYTGFWKSETESADYVAINIKDEDETRTDEPKKAEWSYSSLGGFYWAGCTIQENFIAFGTEDGTGKNNWYDPDVYTNSGKIVTLNKSTGEVIDEFTNIYGDVRSSLCYDKETDRYYFTAKSGIFGSVKIDKNGKISDYETIELGGQSTSTPVIANGRAYVGICGTDAYSFYSGSAIAVIDLETFQIAYLAETKGYPQCGGLLAKSDDGYNYVYFVENTQPSSIKFVKDKKGVTSTIDPLEQNVNDENKLLAPTLFTPWGEQDISGYSICNLICDDDGTIYFKNDDCYVMAVGPKVESLTVKNGKKLYKAGETINIEDFTITANLSNGMEKNVTQILEYTKEPLTEDDIFVTFTYNYGLYGNSEDQAGVKVQPASIIWDISVLEESDYDKVCDVIDSINKLENNENLTKDAITNARNAYDSLSEDLKQYVDNYEILLQLEKNYLENNSNDNKNNTGSTENYVKEDNNLKENTVYSVTEEQNNSKNKAITTTKNPDTGNKVGFALVSTSLMAIIASKKIRKKK